MKFIKSDKIIYKVIVALFTRAWIEIVQLVTLSPILPVALFTRAWIEISSAQNINFLIGSPSLRGRGLKYGL